VSHIHWVARGTGTLIARVDVVYYKRVKRELKRVHRNGCRYNERLNDETGGSKTPRTYWVARVNIQYT
jgi:hypothetical protein